MALAIRSALVLALVLLPAAARAGEGWEIRYRLLEGGVATEADVRVDGDRVAVRPVGGDQEFFLGPEGILLLDHGDRTWGSMTFAELETALEGVRRMFDSMSAAAREAIEQARRTMSPEEAAALDAELGDAAPGSITVHPTPERSSIAGLSVAKAVVRRNGTDLGLAWTTDAIPVAVLEGIVRRLLAAIPPALLGDAEFAAALPGLAGFPLLMEDLEDGDRVEALRAERRSFDAASWTAPAGWTRTAIPGLGDLGGGR